MMTGNSYNKSSNRHATPKKRRSSRKRTHTRSSFFRRYPRWAWWLGGLGVVAIYVCFFYYFFVGPFGFRWRAIYGDAKYPEGYEIRGIDISHYQGDIDWELLQNAMIEKCPIRFILIKATEGTDRIDPKFKENFRQAREYGFIRGAYHFWSNKSSARTQAYFFLNNVYLQDGDLPPVLDIEHKPKDKSLEDFQRDVLTWLHIVEDKYHVKPIIYTYYKFKTTYLNEPVFNDYPYWIAHYYVCLLYTSDAADDTPCVDLGGRRIIKKKFFQAEDGIRDVLGSRGLGDVYKRQQYHLR